MDYRSLSKIIFMKVETIAGLISIYFYLNKLISCHYLQMVSLPKQYIVNSLLDEHHSKKATPYHIVTCYLISKQQLKIKSPTIYTNNHLNRIYPAFNSLNKELSPDFCLVDTFSDCFSFYLVNCKDIDTKIAY